MAGYPFQNQPVDITHWTLHFPWLQRRSFLKSALWHQCSKTV